MRNWWSPNVASLMPVPLCRWETGKRNLSIRRARPRLVRAATISPFQKYSDRGCMTVSPFCCVCVRGMLRFAMDANYRHAGSVNRESDDDGMIAFGLISALWHLIAWLIQSINLAICAITVSGRFDSVSGTWVSLLILVQNFSFQRQLY